MSRFIAAIVAIVVIAGCTTALPDPTVYPTPAPRQSVDDAPAAVDAFLTAWAEERFADMYTMLAEADKARTRRADFVDLLSSFARLTGAQGLEWRVGAIQPVALSPDEGAAGTSPVGPIPALRVPLRLFM